MLINSPNAYFKKKKITLMLDEIIKYNIVSASIINLDLCSDLFMFASLIYIRSCLQF